MTAPRASLAAAAALALLGCAAAPAVAVADPPQPPREITGKVVPGGADGTPHEVMCPAMQHAYGGGYALTASRPGTRLSEEAADVLENRPNDHATGWIVAVHKSTWWREQQGHKPHGGRQDGTKWRDAGPADLTIHVSCTDDVMTHGA
ncbi:hypothetical protein [Streptomyces sp. L2]|uniref:hypothetical protein n=1 Tax=Streptomyces sp. L2 TaxID=2162665 RepID=UPI0010101F9A|nr:hypothetical protein [Streptomyces sp. L2]